MALILQYSPELNGHLFHRSSRLRLWCLVLVCSPWGWQDVLQGHKGSVTSLETVGHRLFSASTDRAVRVWRIEQYG